MLSKGIFTASSTKQATIKVLLDVILSILCNDFPLLGQPELQLMQILELIVQKPDALLAS